MSRTALLLPEVNTETLANADWIAIDVEQHQEVPLLGWVSAGQPIEICEQRESVSVPASMVRKNTYALKVRGNSMVDANIQDGDVIIIEKRESAENGETAVVMINQDRVTLKKLYIEPDGIRLQPANPAMEPIFLRNQDVQVLGIVMGVIRHCNRQ